jgi:hypothetical protein
MLYICPVLRKPFDMKKTLQFAFTFLFALIIAVPFAGAQGSTANANAYLDKVTDGQQQITEDFLSYISAVAHGKTARKIEKRRNDLVTAVAQARSRIKYLNPFEGDTSVKVAAFNYYEVEYNLLKNDYAKIVDMEEIAEESYDKMEAYLMAQEKAEEKLNESYNTWDAAFRAFAARYKITIMEDKSAVAKKAEAAHKVNEYYHQVYLVFFKSYKQEMYLSTAVEKKDLNGIEQSKNTLLKDVTDGFEKLNKIPAFDGDGDLTLTCRKALQFYQKEGKTSVPVVSDFLVKSDNFEKLKKTMNSGGNHSKEDVDNYNKAVHDINAAVGSYNKLNKDDNVERNKVIDEWNNGAQGFLSKHTPRYNK